MFVILNCVFVTFPCGILGQVWELIVSIPDLCRISYFEMMHLFTIYFLQKEIMNFAILVVFDGTPLRYFCTMTTVSFPDISFIK